MILEDVALPSEKMWIMLVPVSPCNQNMCPIVYTPEILQRHSTGKYLHLVLIFPRRLRKLSKVFSYLAFYF